MQKIAKGGSNGAHTTKPHPLVDVVLSLWPPHKAHASAISALISATLPLRKFRNQYLCTRSIGRSHAVYDEKGGSFELNRQA